MTPSESAARSPDSADAPRDCCLRIIDEPELTPADRTRGEALRHSFEAGRGLYHCGECERDFLLAKLYVDDSCIEALDYEFYRVVDAAEQRALLACDAEANATGGLLDLSEYIMNRRPYFARNRAAGGAFQRVQ